jgi:tRNA(Ile)-lysidine synthase
MDSHVLLHLLASQRSLWPQRDLAAIYVDHGLQADSSRWGEHCRRICRELAVPFQLLKVDARPQPGESPEAAARRARYAALSSQMAQETALLTAHHSDDQAETLLLQLLRGAGPHGLAAMPAAAPFGTGWLLRPLLAISRAEMVAYAEQHHLQWIDDASNTDKAFDRNYLRHRILPLLVERWPAAARNLTRSARLCAEAAQWLDAEAAVDLAKMTTTHGDVLSIAGLAQLSGLRQRNVVRHWLRQLGLPIPDHRQLHHLLHDLLTARQDRQPCVRWPGAEVRRYQNQLYAMPPLPAHDPHQVWLWKANAGRWPPLYLPGSGYLQLTMCKGEGVRTETLRDGVLTVRFRTGGERFRPVGRRHGQELKKLCQDAQIPPWQRDRLPLLYNQHELLAVVGLGIADDHQVGIAEQGWKPILVRPSY